MLNEQRVRQMRAELEAAAHRHARVAKDEETPWKREWLCQQWDTSMSQIHVLDLVLQDYGNDARNRIPFPFQAIDKNTVTFAALKNTI
jgi:hypothetical protein